VSVYHFGKPASEKFIYGATAIVRPFHEVQSKFFASWPIAYYQYLKRALNNGEEFSAWLQHEFKLLYPARRRNFRVLR
jgi:hypothetical protein